ncbi:MAG TPA: transglycosylase domain-containing protein [Gaiellaceae bacterium]|nr:transglycosylase domain-containing protein [Gaiellaceae bacterium]
MSPDPRGRGDDLEFILLQRGRKRKRAERVRRRRRAGVAAAAVALAFVAFLVTLGFGAGAALTASCDLGTLRPVGVGRSSFVYARDGSLLGTIPPERNRDPISLRRMSRWLPAATVAVDDPRFYRHGALDYAGLLRAAWHDVTTGHTASSGSTITQQLVRNLYTGPQKAFERKVEEACLAIKLADRWSKPRILDEYLNTVYYGNHAYGAEAAAETYFSKPASRLTLLEAALLAGLPRAPSLYDPFHDPQAALARRDDVLRALLAAGMISFREYERAAQSDSLGLKPGRIYTRIRQPYVLSYVVDRLEQQYGTNTVREGGLRVYTTIDPRLQRLAARAILHVLPRPSDPAAAIVSVEPGTGAIRAMTAVGRGANGAFDLAAQSARQAGSTFKAFVLAAAVEQGIDPDTTIYESAPFTCLRGPWCYADALNGHPWTVHTYENTYLGETSITNATLVSDNTVFAQLTLDVGPQNVWALAHRLGVHMTPDRPVASIGLGSLAVSPVDMAAAYATFPAMGVYAKPMVITKVVLPGGKVDTGSGWGRPRTRRVLSDAVAAEVTHVLQLNAAKGTGAGSCDGVHPCAGKTGTTENHADAWYDGYTRRLATVVWMGYTAGEIPMLHVHGRAVVGATFAVPIWHDYMAAALRSSPAVPFAAPRRPPVWHAYVRGRYGMFGRQPARRAAAG